MLRIIREEFELEAQQTGNTQLLLTAAVGVGKSTVEQAYDIPAMSELLDLIGLMTYDLHGTWESVTGFNAPLFATAEDEAMYTYPVSVSWAVDYWLERGARADQLLVGFGTYGRGWKLADASCNTPLCSTSGPCVAGDSTKLPGYLAYYEIEDLVSRGAATKYYDNDRKAPYIVTTSGDWIGYDDPTSFEAKLDFLKSKNLRGAMTWAIDLDDLSTYPLLNTLKSGLKDYRSASKDPGSTESTSEIPVSTEATSEIPVSTESSEIPVSTESTSEAPVSTESTSVSTVSTSETPVLTEQETTTEGSSGCSTGEYVSVDSRATNAWCQLNCDMNEDWCLSTNFCVCSSDRTMDESGVLTLSTVGVLSLLFLLL